MPHTSLKPIPEPRRSVRNIKIYPKTSGIENLAHQILLDSSGQIMNGQRC